MEKTDEAVEELKKKLGFEIAKSGSFLDWPKNKEPAYYAKRASDGFYMGDARDYTVKLWSLCLKLVRERRRAQDEGKWVVPVKPKKRPAKKQSRTGEL